MARSELITPFQNCPGLARAHQIDFVHSLNTPDLPPSVLKILLGDPLLLMRNVDTQAGLAKGRRGTAVRLGRRNLVVQFDSTGDLVNFGRMPLEKSKNGVKFRRWQMPFRLLFAGTVHRAQGMTLQRVVVDYQTKFWEHGQLYMALSRIRDPHDLCVLLPSGMSNFELEPGVDPEVVRVLD
jgi:ATP-dependent exoDNAse (exonuclease V) alpha subunit